MSNDKQETIADIVADIRAQNQGLPEDDYALSPLVCDLLSLADRIEAAAKREREATREKSSRVGNSAKMRDALSRILGIADHLQTRFDIPRLASEEILELKQIAESALSAQARNCDVGNAEEQYARVRAFCKRHKVGLRCVGCPVNGVLPKNCALIWAQMPYEEGGANGK